MASAPHTAWRRIRTSVATQVTKDIVPLLDERTTSLHARLDGLEAGMRQIEERLRDLREIASTQVDIENQSSELVGRLLRSATDRIEELEERTGHSS